MDSASVLLIANLVATLVLSVVYGGRSHNQSNVVQHMTQKRFLIASVKEENIIHCLLYHHAVEIIIYILISIYSSPYPLRNLFSDFHQKRIRPIITVFT